MRQHNSDVGDGLNVSRMNLRVGTPYHIYVVLQDAPLWFDKHSDHFITNHISTCITCIKDEKITNDIKIFLVESRSKISLMSGARKKYIRHDVIREAAINQHTRNFTKLVGLHIGTPWKDIVSQNRMIKELIVSVLARATLAKNVTKNLEMAENVMA